jgi:hypothetical protein
MFTRQPHGMFLLHFVQAYSIVFLGLSVTIYNCLVFAYIQVYFPLCDFLYFILFYPVQPLSYS